MTVRLKYYYDCKTDMYILSWTEAGESVREVEIYYSTSPSSQALEWLSPAQTLGGKFPYVYSHCQAGDDSNLRKHYSVDL